MVGLAIIGAAGLVAAAIVLVRQPRDAGLWVMAISPFLLHPVLATGIIFMLGHAGPVTAKIMRRRGWRWPSAIGLGAASSLVAVGAVLALPVTAGLLPYLAAAALAIIVPHLLPASWFLEAAIPQPHGPGQRTQAATSPAT